MKPDKPGNEARRDRLYAAARDAIADFRFDDDVASVFPDMIERSVPGYATVIGMTTVLAERFARDGSNLYDLGCSLGASSYGMAQGIAGRRCRVVAVDNSTAMIARLTERLERSPPPAFA
ncbi:MAG: hypothetical protein DWQ08_06980 [Proteobacteria bacterium]|nr:MAG: hypothetical protein DWQ08_06980 [Pseudomonadota bacterium]